MRGGQSNGTVRGIASPESDSILLNEDDELTKMMNEDDEPTKMMNGDDEKKIRGLGIKKIRDLC